MSRKDYRRIASDVAIEYRAAERAGQDYAMRAIIRLAESFADLFAADNPNFDRARFLTACREGN